MLYLDSTNVWVRRDQIATAVGTPVARGGGGGAGGRGRGRGAGADSSGRGAAGAGARAQGAAAGADSTRVSNGISGDARRSTIKEVTRACGNRVGEKPLEQLRVRDLYDIDLHP